MRPTARPRAGRQPRLAHCVAAVILACANLPAAAAAPPAPAAHATGQSGNLAELLHLLAARRNGRVAYTEVREMAILKSPLQSSGELVYEAPDRLEKRILTPKPETLILDKGVLTARRGSHTRVLALHEYPQVVPFVESIRATLAGDRAALEHYFHVEFSGELDHWTLRLVPADDTVARKVDDIRITGERDAIRTVEIRQTDGDRSLLTIGPEIPP